MAKSNSTHNKENNPPPSKRVTRSTFKNPPPRERFDFDGDDDFEELCLRFVPQNTSTDTRKWVCAFEELERDRHIPVEKVPGGVLLMDDYGQRCKCPCRLCTEMRKKQGGKYHPAASSTNIVFSLSYVMLSHLLFTPLRSWFWWPLCYWKGVSWHTEVTTRC